MRLLLAVLAAQIALCQGDEDAAKILRAVADAAAASTAWEVDGATVYPQSGAHAASIEPFRLLVGGANKIRFEQEGPAAPATIVCDGTSAFIYSPPLNRFHTEPAANNRLCSRIFGDWKTLADSLTSTTVKGVCGPDPEAAPSGFTLIGGFADPEVVSAGKLAWTLCIDAERKLIVWEKWQSRYGSRANVYSRYTRPARFEPETFRFTPPSGATATDLHLPVPVPLGYRPLPVDSDVVLPQVVPRTPLNYPPSNRGGAKPSVERTVMLYVVVDASGAPSEVLVYKPLVPQFDDEAVRSVRKWRFKPGTQSLRPVPLPVLVEMNWQGARR